MKEYPSTESQVPEDNTADAEPTVQSLKNDIEALQTIVTADLTRLENKVDKLIESTKSLIAYFTALHENNARDVNYNIRSFSTSKILPPMGFVPNHTK